MKRRNRQDPCWRWHRTERGKRRFLENEESVVGPGPQMHAIWFSRGNVIVDRAFGQSLKPADFAVVLTVRSVSLMVLCLIRMQHRVGTGKRFSQSGLGLAANLFVLILSHGSLSRSSRAFQRSA